MDFETQLLILIAAIAALLFLTVWAAILAPRVKADTIRAILLGLHAPPALVGAARALATALGSAVVTALAGWLTDASTGALGGVAAAALVLLQVAWGLADQALKPTANQGPPPVAR